MQADVVDGQREGVPSEVQAELARFTGENKRLREMNEILHRASILFAGELEPRARYLRVHRRSGQRRLHRRVDLRRPHC
jgi:ActR/RegA family two-component response regulator